MGGGGAEIRSRFRAPARLLLQSVTLLLEAVYGMFSGRFAGPCTRALARCVFVAGRAPGRRVSLGPGNTLTSIKGHDTLVAPVVTSAMHSDVYTRRQSAEARILPAALAHA